MATDVVLLRGVEATTERPARAQRRAAGREEVAFLSAPGAAALERLTGDESLVTGLPVLMGWRPFGPQHELRGPELQDLLEDLGRLAHRPGLAGDVVELVAELRLLAQRAVDEGLALVVSPD